MQKQVEIFTTAHTKIALDNTTFRISRAYNNPRKLETAFIQHIQKSDNKSCRI